MGQPCDCPFCELRFRLETELREHIWRDHPEPAARQFAQLLDRTKGERRRERRRRQPWLRYAT